MFSHAKAFYLVQMGSSCRFFVHQHPLGFSDVTPRTENSQEGMFAKNSCIEAGLGGAEANFARSSRQQSCAEKLALGLHGLVRG
jgi:hypothetical protein